MRIFSKIKRNIPNGVTCLNLFSGCLSIVFSFEGNLAYASYFIGFAAIFDFLDGFTARILKAFSYIGKDMDSLADVISFGLAPSVILFKLLQNELNVEYLSFKNIDFSILIILLSPFLVVIFSALRLAKFNNDIRQTNGFIGLPTPANAILIASLPLILASNCNSIVYQFLVNKYFLLLLIFILCYLLISEIPMFSLKFKNLKYGNNRIQYILLFTSLILIMFFKYTAIPLIIFFYIILSITNNLILKNK